MGQSFRAIITLQEPVNVGGGHPDQGLPGAGWGGGHPDQGLPGMGGHPDQGLPGSGHHPGHLPVWPDDAPPGTVWPPLPPGFEGDGKKAIVLAAIEGVGYRYIVIEVSGEHPDNELPEGGEGDEGPDQGLPGEGEDGDENKPDQGLPGQRPPHVGNRPPGQGAPPRPGQGLPPQGRPPQPGQGLPGQGAPPRPGQGLPPAPQPKPVGRR